MTREVLIRADDLGFSEGINYGIEKSVRQGIIKTIGIMTNMPATQHGYDLVKDLDLCFGLHTNICVGKPLCDPKLVPSICDENGNLKSSKTYRQAFKEGYDFVNLDEVILEIEAQYQRFVELTGDKPHYFEGHAVMSMNFFKGMEIVAK
ncbi:MAG: ChbG/HpnK family deacetylase, partial [Holdemanella sp.]|nr:ChbG/HpnK family deacetylase [Holdemanella sp.]